MALTAYVPVASANVPVEIDSVVFGTITGGAGGDNVTIDAAVTQAIEILFDDVSPPNSHSEAGVPVKSTSQLTVDLATLGESGATTFANELVTEVIAYIKVTWVGGKFFELDSGTTGKAILYFRRSLVQGEEGQIWRLIGQRTLPRNNVVIA